MLFHRWHPQLYLRYAPIVDYVKKLPDSEKLSILEVGPGSLGIGPYLNQKFTGVDVNFAGPNWPQMTKIVATSKALPLQNKSFDIVICTDTLEHIPPESRHSVITELLRVTKSDLILAFPFGKGAAQQDQELDQLYRHRFGQPFPFLTEHIRYELPDTDQVKTWIEPVGEVNILTKRNLKLRSWLMAGWMTKNLFIDLFFRKILMLFLPLLKLLDQSPPHYRVYFFVKINA